ncbi:MAG: hypothetical protein EHM70_17735 [Chloroflexota bacterium]|nr:MAG: hypothetical protein EHM70_17735 [Chloroflexota bacterium]
MWEEICRRINAVQRTDPGWISQRDSILAIVAKAQELGLDPVVLLSISLSNWSTVIREVKRAMRWEDWQFFRKVLKQAVTMTNADLRLTLHVSEQERIVVVQEGDHYNLKLTSVQFERVIKGTRARHEYNILPI